METDVQLAASGVKHNVRRGMADSPYQIRVAKTQPEVESLRDFWLQHNQHPDAEIDFYTMFNAGRNPISMPFIPVVWNKGEITAILIGRLDDDIIPFKIGYSAVARVKARRLAFLQDGFLGERNTRTAQALVSCAISYINDGVADMATFSNLNPESEIYTAAKRLPGIWVRDYSRNVNQRWRMTLPKDLEQFLKGCSRKHRYDLRRSCRVFEEAHRGRLRYVIYNKLADVDNFCAAAEEVARHTYQRGLGVGFRNTPEARKRVELEAKKGWLKGYVVWVDDEPLAFWCGRLYNRVMYIDWTGFKPAYSEFKVGTVLFLKMVEDLCDSGASSIDFGSGGAVYKERFGDNNHPEESVSIYAQTLKGISMGIARAAEQHINRSLKALFSKMKIVDIVKKYWRKRLATKVTKGEA